MKSKSLRGALVATSTALLAAASVIAYADTSTQDSTGTRDGMGQSMGQQGSSDQSRGNMSQSRESAGQYVDDATLTTKVKSAFIEDDKVGAMRINVTTNKGIVQLSGFANSAQEADRAAELARQIPGVKDVKNNIEVKGSTR